MKGFLDRIKNKKYQYSKEGLEKQREYGRIGGLKSGKIRFQNSIERDIEASIVKKYPEIDLIRSLASEFLDLDLSRGQCISMFFRWLEFAEILKKNSQNNVIYDV